MDLYIPRLRSGAERLKDIERQTWRFDLKRWKRLSAWVFVLGFSLTLTMITGCNNDVVEVSGPCTPNMEINLIIAQPLAPAPGDTTLLTLQSEGEGCGDWAAYTWTVEAGELIQEVGIAVQWVAPMEYGIYDIQCRATLTGVGPNTSQTLIMVTETEYLETGKVASIKPTMMINDLYFIAEQGEVGPRSNDFLGWAVYSLSGTGVIKLVTDTVEPSDRGAYEFEFVKSGESIFGAFITNYYAPLRQQRMNTWKFPTRFGDPVNASEDEGGVHIQRKNQHRYPKANVNGDKAVWKFQSVGEASDGTIDLFNVAYWDESSGPGGWYTVTQSHDSATVIVGPDTILLHRYYNNIRPMFTPNEDNILYFVDTTRVFEPCLIPMVGGEPDTFNRRALMVDENTGIFEEAGVYMSENTVFEWNPSVPFLSFISSGTIVFFDYASEIVTKVNELSNVSEFAWANDGSQLAAVNDIGVYLVGAGGAAASDPIFRRERATDDIIGIGWNSSGTKIAFRLVRKGKTAVESWSALVIIDLNSGFWSYASKSILWHGSREPDDIDYTWMRVLFNVDDTGVYAPFPVLDDDNYPGKDVILIHSHQ